MNASPYPIVYVSTVPWQRVAPRFRRVCESISQTHALTYVYCPAISYVRLMKEGDKDHVHGSLPHWMRYIRVYNLFPKRFERLNGFDDAVKCLLLRALLGTPKRDCVVWFGHPSVYKYVNRLGDAVSVFDTSDLFSQKSTLTFYEHQPIDYSFIPIFYDHRQGGKNRVKIVRYTKGSNIRNIYLRVFRAVEDL